MLLQKRASLKKSSTAAQNAVAAVAMTLALAVVLLNFILDERSRNFIVNGKDGWIWFVPVRLSEG